MQSVVRTIILLSFIVSCFVMGLPPFHRFGSRSFALSALRMKSNSHLNYVVPLHSLFSTSSIVAAAGGQTPKEKFRKDYKKLPWSMTSVNLNFKLADSNVPQVNNTLVSSDMILEVAPSHDPKTDLVLDCEDIELRQVKINGLEVLDYFIADNKLTIPAHSLPLLKEGGSFNVETVSALDPASNLQLSGLYKSSGMYCTQCEAEGFRRISPLFDRPDMMTKYLVRLEADKKKYPVLLSNGNKLEEGDVGNGNHYAIWEDPFKKPSYLFALVAGDLGSITDTFVTQSKRKVHLEIFSERGNEDQLEHAMRSLKRAMKWDEDRFGLEYDLDVYNIVAVGDFNMGAMENKGLNIFNTALTLAKKSTATDADYERIESVIGHEYFHNWSGNRVTCRDWFQLTLKEGLTVYRDQEFSKDMGNREVCRICEVRGLRARQFPEDDGPMAHPIRPESYIAMDNFYTTTVYEKGAEVIRMYETLLGRDKFRSGVDLYFERHDGQAVTCDDFRFAMADASGVDLTQFENWYTQAGTPTVKVDWQEGYNPTDGSFTFTLSQSCRTTNGSKIEPFHIPVLIGLLNAETGEEVLKTTLVELKDETHSFRLQLAPNLKSGVVPSFLRNFSAPVKLDLSPVLSTDDLSFIMKHDTDAYNRWDASQSLLISALLEQASSTSSSLNCPTSTSLGSVVTAVKSVLSEAVKAKTDFHLAAVLLAVPTVGELCQVMQLPVDPVAAAQARRRVKQVIAESATRELLECFHATKANQEEGSFSIEPEEQGRRALHNLCLDYLTLLKDVETDRVGVSLALAEYQAASCMTEKMGALVTLAPFQCEETEVALADFEKGAEGALVMDKWFAVQASVQSIDKVRALLEHPKFTWSNPNRMRSVLSHFASGNLEQFHSLDGEGYRLVGDAVLKIDEFNHQVSARLAQSFSTWHRYDTTRQELMKAQLRRFKESEKSSKELYEVSSRSLQTQTPFEK